MKTKKFTIIFLILIVITFACTKEDVVKLITVNDIDIEDKRTIKSKTGINPYADLKFENKDVLSLQTNSSGWTCDNTGIANPYINGSLVNNNTKNKEFKVDKIKIENFEFDISKTNAVSILPLYTKEFINLYGRTVTVSFFGKNDKLIVSKDIKISTPFCPENTASYDSERNAFVISKGQDLEINWNSDGDNIAGIAIGLTQNKMISTSTKKAYIVIEDDDGSVTINASKIEDNRSITVALFSEVEIEISEGNKVSFAVLHYGNFPLFVE